MPYEDFESLSDAAKILFILWCTEVVMHHRWPSSLYALFAKVAPGASFREAEKEVVDFIRDCEELGREVQYDLRQQQARARSKMRA